MSWLEIAKTRATRRAAPQRTTTIVLGVAFSAWATYSMRTEDL